MLPEITILGRVVPSYGIFAALACIAALLFVALQCLHLGLSVEDGISIAAFGGIGALLGAKLLYLLTTIPQLLADWPLLCAQPRAFLIKYLSGGLVFYGGALGALLGAAGAAWQKQTDLNQFFPALVPALALAHGIARMGCFCAGCCYGVPSARFGIAFSASLTAPNGVPLLPVQLYEAAAELAIFAFLLWFVRSPARRADTLYVWVFCYAPVRFVLEFFRGDVIRGIWLGLSTSQWLSLAMLAAATLCSIRHSRQREKSKKRCQ